MLERALHGILVGALRRTWLVAVATVVVCAAFAAHAVAALADARLQTVAPPAGAPPPKVAARPSRTPPDGRPLVARNMFCSTCSPIVDEPGSPDSFVSDAILIATAIGADPLATVRVPGSEVQGSWSVGDTIPGVGRVASISWQTIDIVDARGRRGRISLVGAGAATPSATSTRAPAADAAAGDAAWRGRITKLAEREFSVERSLVRDLVGGSVGAAGVRALPMQDHGALTGLRLFGVRDGSLAATLGLQNGDVLEAINNTHIESANTLLGIYADLDRLSVVELEGTRAGKPLAITLRLK